MVANDRILHRLDGREIGAHVLHVRIAHFCIGRIGHRRIEPLALVAAAVPQRRREFHRGQGADAGLDIGRDVGGQESPEWSLKYKAAGERLAAGCCVATRAVAKHGQITPPFDLIEILIVLRAYAAAARQHRDGNRDKGPHRYRDHASGPGFLRYRYLIASAVQ